MKNILLTAAILTSFTSCCTTKTGLISDKGKSYATEYNKCKGVEYRYEVLKSATGRFYIIKNGKRVNLYRRQPKGYDISK